MNFAIVFPKDSEAMFNKNVTRSFGGNTVQMYLISKELKNRENQNIQCHSLIPEYSEIDFEEKDFFNLVTTYSEKDSFIRKTNKFHNTLKRLKPDMLIQTGLTIYSCFLAKYCKRNKIKFIFIFAHDDEASGLYQENKKKCSFFKMLLKNSSVLITQNNYQKNKLKQTFNTDSYILKVSIDITEKYNPENRKEILWISRCAEWKQPELFINLAQKHPQYKFKMICPNIEGKESFFNFIKNEAKTVSNLKFIDFANKRDIASYYKDAKVFINTSIAEGFPNTFLEAGLYSVPIVSLNTDPDNFLVKYQCGFECNNDLNRMSEKLIELMDNRKLFERYSENAYKYVKEKHSIQKNVDKLLNIIKNSQSHRNV